MQEIKIWFAGAGWASQKHDVWLTDAGGKGLGKRTFAHSGEGLAQMCAWLIATSGGQPEDIHVAIEVPHGAVVETLLDSGINTTSGLAESEHPVAQQAIAASQPLHLRLPR